MIWYFKHTVWKITYYLSTPIIHSDTARVYDFRATCDLASIVEIEILAQRQFIW